MTSFGHIDEINTVGEAMTTNEKNLDSFTERTSQSRDAFQSERNNSYLNECVLWSLCNQLSLSLVEKNDICK